jgi:hypothetical protein
MKTSDKHKTSTKEEVKSPSWLIAKFWTAVVVGAIIYCFEKLFGPRAPRS